MQPEQEFVSRSAAVFRGMLNDLKRNEQVAAQELGVDPGLIADVLKARRAPPPDLVARAVTVWPVNERDFYPLHDDAPTGARIMRADESEASQRIIARGGVPYYEYRDTAMSRICPIRPEWIKILTLVDDNDPDNKAVRWNNGHLLFQFTYFIGPVNYYYAWKGQRRCIPMNTGDTVFGPPYAPHTFATRKPGSPGLILALTFGGRLVGEAQHELGVLPTDAVTCLGEPSATGNRPSSARLRSLMAERSVTAARLAAASGLAESRVEMLLDGSRVPTAEEAEQIAASLRVPVRDLLGNVDDLAEGVKVVRAGEAAEWAYPDEEAPSYRVRQLATSSVAPFASSLEITPLLTSMQNAAASFVSGTHQFAYLLGNVPIVLAWSHSGTEHSEVIEPGDSFYLKPFVAHSFRTARNVTAADDCKVLVLRIGGRLWGDAAYEAALLGSEGLARLRSDLERWYND